MSAPIPFSSSAQRRAGRFGTALLAAALGLAASSDAALADLPSPPHKGKGRPSSTAAAATDAGTTGADAGAAHDAPDASGPPMDPAQQKAQLDDIRAKATRIARAKGQRQLLRTKVEELMRGQGMDPGLKQELLVHARRVARLERARAVATEAKDAEQATRAEDLLKRESTRHDGWMASFSAKVKKP